MKWRHTRRLYGTVRCVKPPQLHARRACLVWDRRLGPVSLCPQVNAVNVVQEQTQQLALLLQTRGDTAVRHKSKVRLSSQPYAWHRVTCKRSANWVVCSVSDTCTACLTLHSHAPPLREHC